MNQFASWRLAVKAPKVAERSNVNVAYSKVVTLLEAMKFPFTISHI